MGTTTIRNIMFFMFILKSLVIQSVSKPFLEQKNVINFHKNIRNPKLDLNNIYLEKLWKKMLWGKEKFLSVRKIYHNNKKNTIITNIKPEELRQRLNFLNQKSQIKILKYNSIVHASVESYLRMGKYIGKIISLSDFYFPMFEEKLENYRLPKELKYLAIIESNLNPVVTSKTGAQGIWQFMPETGKIYNLNVNNIYDERNDPIQSTEAACRYLKFLYKKIGNWELVLAAYNAGPGTVDKILQRHKNRKNFWELWESFPKETQSYIPKFIAINYIMNYYKEHNIYTHYPSPYKYKYTETALIPIKEKISLKFFAYSLNISYKDLILLNPKYLVDLIPSGNKLRLPKNKILLFKSKEGFFSKKIHKN
ncbi:lytic transglycosylase domain-containing protein [Blattabacterium sp. (Blaberus giganteus)]|uniref:lytic transglycosylase domain-containing protein n=1 Tax=Blattabacterium sp. (Blaberus giganteus) TaxID=1186051 RepID=UPI00025F7074|nr:lytic transglycosylase domain-containing protein [Blattabacterium sp. (Blaberus giganteus)]AFJ90494.1 membrane-bound lytic murein transglycosylase [Blattabacterium sp. (Blaberus giganteus)]